MRRTDAERGVAGNADVLTNASRPFPVSSLLLGRIRDGYNTFMTTPFFHGCWPVSPKVDRTKVRNALLSSIGMLKLHNL